jgi:hypothetical protein
VLRTAAGAAPTRNDVTTYGGWRCSRRGAAMLHTAAGAAPARNSVATYGGRCCDTQRTTVLHMADDGATYGGRRCSGEDRRCYRWPALLAKLPTGQWCAGGGGAARRSPRAGWWCWSWGKGGEDEWVVADILFPFFNQCGHGSDARGGGSKASIPRGTLSGQPSVIGAVFSKL